MMKEPVRLTSAPAPILFRHHGDDGITADAGAVDEDIGVAVLLVQAAEKVSAAW